MVSHVYVEPPGPVALWRGGRGRLARNSGRPLDFLQRPGLHLIRHGFEAALDTQEALASLRIERVYERVVYVVGQIGNGFYGGVQLRLDDGSRPFGGGSDFLGLGELVHEFVLDGGHRLAVVAAQVFFYRLGHDGVASEQDVGHGLRSDHLAHRGDERREAEVGAGSGNLLKHVAHPVERARLAELGDHVGRHAAGYLVAEDARVNDGGARSLQVVGVLGQDFFQLVAQIEQRAEVNARVAVGPAQGHGYGFDGGLGCSESEGR